MTFSEDCELLTLNLVGPDGSSTQSDGSSTRSDGSSAPAAGSSAQGVSDITLVAAIAVGVFSLVHVV